MTPGEINYAAYRTTRNGKTFDGREAPTWEQLDFGIKEAWEEGAKAVIKDYSNTPDMPMLNLSQPESEVPTLMTGLPISETPAVLPDITVPDYTFEDDSSNE